MATVAKIDSENITLDLNHELAGKHLNFDVELVKHCPAERMEKVAFGAGCFWGPELAFQRTPGGWRGCWWGAAAGCWLAGGWGWGCWNWLVAAGPGAAGTGWWLMGLGLLGLAGGCWGWLRVGATGCSQL